MEGHEVNIHQLATRVSMEIPLMLQYKSFSNDLQVRQLSPPSRQSPLDFDIRQIYSHSSPIFPYSSITFKVNRLQLHVWF